MNADSVVLVINCGSSSIKFSVLDVGHCEVVLSGIADSIGSDNAFLVVDKTTRIALADSTYEAALAAIAGELDKRQLMDAVRLIGHRIAHGGDIFSDAVIITDEVMEQIKRVSPLAPLHNYANLAGVTAARHLFPGLPQVAVFDTGFHQTLKPEAYLYGLPYQFAEQYGVRRYGFHGTSHRYVASEAVAMLDLDENDAGLVIAHLGNGASICAVQDGKSVDTSMGMTPLEGLIMGTRSGDVDFGALTYLADKTGQSMAELERVVNKESGLLGLSGLSSDLRVLEQAYQEGHAGAHRAIGAFVHRIARHIGGHASALRRLDGVIFTGGIGENSVLIRQLVMARLKVFGIEVDEAKNAQPNRVGARVVSSDRSRAVAAVIPTNEEKMIAQDAIRLGQCVLQPEFA
ncbi:MULTISPECIES: propionate kinase [Atlantibacter]|uniref:Propionate kinase n=1 Tax=Atlantibacter hermannii NBRC 105704 TaxID=1115512 RepID=H5V285_ATLHE|nr:MULTISPECIES: propionate kinase [Atlantibacter]MCQ4967446.1 propionate kinase [Enterobacteriaceae bacterium DFI.7.85]KIU35634.1 propionate kinase [Atlantibacter hermannii]MDQ7881545.1 propionate kinase [Atlantibacter hermannii]MDU7813548.1 propionate kinase [Atlantibacter hermannii]QPS93721.1 propionate kinase [Atlantibacter hermannii]